MRIVIQIPCFNEERSLPDVLKDIPREILGADEVLVQVINDGSTDDTAEVAAAYQVDFILNNIGNKGLAYSFHRGMMHALNINADILVNTDGDNQYPSRYIEDLVRPIINKQADIVVGNRQTQTISHFSRTKKFFQWLGTRATITLSGDDMLEDAVSGFRAYSREALCELNITSSFSYILDTTIQASNKKLKTLSIPIHTNAPTRKSRLFSNMWEHMYKSGKQLLRVFAMYKPLRVFFGLGSIFFLIGAIPIIRFLYAYFFGFDSDGKIQSLVIGCMFISISMNMMALGILGDLLSKNRQLIEANLRQTKERMGIKM